MTIPQTETSERKKERERRKNTKTNEKRKNISVFTDLTQATGSDLIILFIAQPLHYTYNNINSSLYSLSLIIKYQPDIQGH